MDILFLAPRLPYPADTGGKIRTLNILKQLLKFARVHLVCFSFEAQDEKHKEEIKKTGALITLVPAQESSFLQKARNVCLGAFPHSIAKYDSSLMKTVLEKLSEDQRFDAVHIDHLHMAHYIKCFNGIPCFLDEHNVEYKILERCAEVEKNSIKKILYRQQALKMKTFETAKINEFKGVFACSEDDQGILNALSPGRRLFTSFLTALTLTILAKTARIRIYPRGKMRSYSQVPWIGCLTMMPSLIFAVRYSL